MGLILGCREKEKRSNSLIINLLKRLSSGERGIRTPGTSQCGSFQDCCNRPLYHLSVCMANLRRKRGMDKEFVGNLLKTFEDGMKSRGIAL